MAKRDLALYTRWNSLKTRFCCKSSDLCSITEEQQTFQHCLFVCLFVQAERGAEESEQQVHPQVDADAAAEPQAVPLIVRQHRAVPVVAHRHADRIQQRHEVLSWTRECSISANCLWHCELGGGRDQQCASSSAIPHCTAESRS